MPTEPAIEISNLTFSFEAASPEPPLIDRFSLAIPAGARVLLIGANGVGKSTLLRLLAGKHLVPEEVIRVWGRSPFHDLGLSSEISWIGGDLEIDLDIQVGELLRGGRGSRHRDRELLELFEIAGSWRMCRVSDGQRRRVQLLLGLRNPGKLILLDEVTAHLDVTMRADFLKWLKADARRRGATVLYATHIFDGLDRLSWPTHLLWLGFGGKSRFGSLRAFAPDLKKADSLSALCEKWIRANLPKRRSPSRYFLATCSTSASSSAHRA